VASDYVRHHPNGPEVRGPEAERQLVAMYLAAFPDLRFTIEHLIAEGTPYWPASPPVARTGAGCSASRRPAGR
jgi:hypothetical protein